MKIRKTTIKKTDPIATYLPAGYSDAFECVIQDGIRFTADDFMIAFWTCSPAWIDKLFALRDLLVKPFGLQTGSKGRSKEEHEQAVRNGGSYGLMRVESKSESETIISLMDKHLQLYFSVRIDKAGNEDTLTVASVVHFHNLFGKVYFYAICLFHKTVTIVMMKHALNCVHRAER